MSTEEIVLPAQLAYLDLLDESTEKLLMDYSRSQDKLSGFDKYFGSMVETPSGDRTTPAEEYQHYWHKALFDRDKTFSALVGYIVELEQRAEEAAGYRKRCEYLEAALRRIIEAANSDGTADTRREVTGIAGCAILGSWTRDVT